jgi:hypothetical protein
MIFISSTKLLFLVPLKEPGLSVGWAARPIDLRIRPIRVKRALTDRPW